MLGAIEASWLASIPAGSNQRGRSARSRQRLEDDALRQLVEAFPDAVKAQVGGWSVDGG